MYYSLKPSLCLNHFLLQKCEIKHLKNQKKWLQLSICFLLVWNFLCWENALSYINSNKVEKIKHTARNSQSKLQSAMSYGPSKLRNEKKTLGFDSLRRQSTFTDSVKTLIFRLLTKLINFRASKISFLSYLQKVLTYRKRIVETLRIGLLQKLFSSFYSA